MKIREERRVDEAAIHALTMAAFKGHPYSDGTEPGIISDLRNAGALSLSLVAADRDEVVGHVAFSPVMIDGADCGWFGLGPISVTPDRQRQGIGSLLIRDGLKRLSALGAKGVVLLGDPAYYTRFGFACHADLVLPNVPADYFMARTLQGPNPTGEVAYHAAFGS